MFTNILVPIDLDEPDEHALELAITLASEQRARITLFHVYEIPSIAYSDPFPWPIERLEEAARTAMQQQLVQTRQRYPACEGVIDVGTVWHRIIEYARAAQADLIVM